MGIFLIRACTLISIAIIILRRLHNRNNKRIIPRIKATIREINLTYKSIFKEKSRILRALQCTIFLGAEFFAATGILTVAYKYYLNNKSIIVLGLSIIMVLVALIILHISIGYILLITSGIEKFLINMEDENIKLDLIISYFILSMYTTVFIVFRDEFISSSLIGLIGLAISYYLNLRVLGKIIDNPNRLKNNKNGAYNTAAVASIIILFMIIINLFLAVVLINQASPNAFAGNPNNFDLFYYTMITFVTIGYGDIVPVSVPAKIISIIIGITSVICITIFLSTMLSHKSEQEKRK